MAIPVKNNTLYGGNLINQKYAPLDVNAVELSIENIKLYKDFFKNRLKYLENQNLFPAQLNLYSKNWNQIQINEMDDAALPPIIVVSSNRAEWIKSIYDTSHGIQKKNYQHVNDNHALVCGSTPWYDPKRINNPNRHVYILVHKLEYDYYKRILNDAAFTIVGWSFDSNINISGKTFKRSLAGFGASRFAAIEFCKYIFNTQIAPFAPKPPIATKRQKAWLVDDNVVYVQSFPGFTEVEKEMPDECWGMGFMGATVNAEDDEIKRIKGTAPANLKPEGLLSKGILQQCVLWNIHELNDNSVNYSPSFLNSNEDTSFSNFLQNQDESRIRIVKGASVIKGIPTNGSNIEGQNLSFLKNLITQGFYAIEKAGKVTPIPTDQGGEQDFSNYTIVNILPNANTTIRNEDPTLTECRAVEQIMAKVCADKLKWLTEGKDKVQGLFKPKDGTAFKTQHF